MILRITLKVVVKNFCMSKGSTLEFKDGGFKWIGIDQPFYPNFGPYVQLNEIAELMVAGKGNGEMHKMFIAESIPDAETV